MQKKWKIYWVLTAAEGFAAEIWILCSRSEIRNAFLFGLSKYKLALALGILGLAAFCLLALRFVSEADDRMATVCGVIAYFFAWLLLLGRVFLLPPLGITAFAKSVSERILPLALWMGLFVLQTFIILLLRKKKEIRNLLRSRNSSLIVGTVVFLLLGGMLFVAEKTGWGLEWISGTFYRQAISLLEGHIVLPLLAIFPLMPFFEWIGNRKRNNRFFAILISLLIWLAAALTWKNVPFEGRSYFLPALRLPNLNFYPSSDAENYDMLAQSILIGNGFRNGMTVVRPLYVAFLALLHHLVGDNYMYLTDLQIFVLALLPVCVYWIGRVAHRPSTGILAAVWVILREVYSIRVTPLVQISNSRLLMSDMPMALMAAVLMLLVMLSCQRKNPTLWTLSGGGVLGLSMLLRTQSLIFLPAMWLLYFCVSRKNALKNMLFCLIGLSIVFAPWVIWNRVKPNDKLNGDTSETNYLVKLYRRAVLDPDEAAANRDSLLKLMLDHPRKANAAISAHFFNNEIDSLLILPEREEAVTDPEQYLYDSNVFWYRISSRGVLAKNQGLTVLYILVIALGVCSAFGHSHVVGLFPLIAHLFYNMGNALALNSGFRFVLPVDWVFLLYFAAGCISLMRILWRVYCGDCGLLTLPEYKAVSSRRSVAVMLILLLIAGSLLPILDGGIPYAFSNYDADSLLMRWQKTHAAPETAVGYVGRVVYPRFYKSGEGDSGASSSVKKTQQYDRMVWMFLDREVRTLVMPFADDPKMPPFADPQDVFIVGIPKNDYITVLEMIPLDELEERIDG